MAKNYKSGGDVSNVTLQRFSVQFPVTFSACLFRLRFLWMFPSVLSSKPPPPTLPVSLQPVRKEWWTRSLFASVSHQLQPHRVLHLSTPDEALAQQTVLLWWVGASSSRSLLLGVKVKLVCKRYKVTQCQWWWLAVCCADSGIDTTANKYRTSIANTDAIPIRVSHQIAKSECFVFPSLDY